MARDDRRSIVFDIFGAIPPRARGIVFAAFLSLVPAAWCVHHNATVQAAVFGIEADVLLSNPTANQCQWNKYYHYISGAQKLSTKLGDYNDYQCRQEIITISISAMMILFVIAALYAVSVGKA